MDTLTTLYALRQHLGFDPTDTADDGRLLAALQAATQAIERHTQRTFLPRLATLPHDVDLRDVREVLLRDDLLALVQVINGDGNALALSDVLVLPGGVLRLLNGNAFTFLDTPSQAVQVRAIWGHHPDYAHAWMSSGDTVHNAPLLATETTLSVSDAQHFQVGQVLRIGDEFLRVQAADAGTNALTVERGARGTVAAQHAAAAPIAIYQPAPDVAAVCLQWATWVYRSPDTPTTPPPPLRDALATLRRIRVA